MLSELHQVNRAEVWGGNHSIEKRVNIAGLDAWVYSKPASGARGGGDVYYVSSCARGRTTRLLVADVDGPDRRDVLSRHLRGLMRKHVNQIDPSRFVRSMSRQFVGLSARGADASALVTTYFAPTRLLSLCNAGHPPPLLYRAKTGEWSLLEHKLSASDCFAHVPPGIMDLSNYDQLDVRLDTGDLVLCYSASLIEACDRAGAMLGEAGLLGLVRTIDLSDPSHFVARLVAELRDRCDANLAGDAVTLLLFRPNGSLGAAPLLERVLTPFRVLKSFLVTLGSDRPTPWPEVLASKPEAALAAPMGRVRAPTAPASLAVAGSAGGVAEAMG